ncbi:hypothetical protein HYO34_23015 [Vibrio parahaemolyticus]|nr:hypothetical protein [Vibrio parahaemolyticus]MBM4910089.1 hypothetical protein [Vibrio parahaemolyticus]MBM4932697.1 hypothetical protein [Vibrio parahaemolyticus]MBM4991988.1 hypothetical protein [Vibrio parahaemolyticus]
MLFEEAMVNGKILNTDPSTFSQRRKRAFETIRGPQTGMLPRLDLPGAQGAFKDSMIHFCNSHYLSQFAAFFIDGRTKRSVAKSCFLDLDDRITGRFHRKMNFIQILDHQKCLCCVSVRRPDAFALFDRPTDATVLKWVAQV